MIYLKELACIVMKTDKSRIYSVGRLETQGRSSIAIQVCRLSTRRIPSCFRGGHIFVLFVPSTDWMRPIIIENNLIYFKATDLKVNLNTLTETLRMFDKMSRHYDPARLAHNTDHRISTWQPCRSPSTNPNLQMQAHSEELLVSISTCVFWRYTVRCTPCE